MGREVKFRFRLKLILEKWGTYKKGDVDTFFISLLDEKSGLIRYGIDKQWEVVSCDEFTGLKDKNGVDIYEGDIFHCNGIHYVLKYKTLGGAYTVHKIKDDTDERFLHHCHHQIEVIGNVHESPKLLIPKK